MAKPKSPDRWGVTRDDGSVVHTWKSFMWTVADAVKTADNFTNLRWMEPHGWRLRRNAVDLGLLTVNVSEDRRLTLAFEPVQGFSDEFLDTYRDVAKKFNDVTAFLRADQLLVRPNVEGSPLSSLNLACPRFDFTWELCDAPKFPWDLSHLGQFFRPIPVSDRAKKWCARELTRAQNPALVHPDNPIPLQCLFTAVRKLTANSFTCDRTNIIGPEFEQAENDEKKLWDQVVQVTGREPYL